MAKKKEEEMVVCPVGKFFMDLQKLSLPKSKFLRTLGSLTHRVSESDPVPGG